MNEGKEGQGEIDPCVDELMRQLRHCCARAPIEPRHRGAALISVLFGMMERREVSPVAMCSTFSTMWNEAFGQESLSDPNTAIDVLAATLGQLQLMPQPSAQAKIQGLLSCACQLVARSGLNGSEFVDVFLRTWRRYMNETPIGGLSLLTLAPGRLYAAELEQLVEKWEQISVPGIVGLLIGSICLAARRAPVSRQAVHAMIDEHWDCQKPEPMS